VSSRRRRRVRTWPIFPSSPGGRRPSSYGDQARDAGGRPERSRVCLVGPSTLFLSGITYYTFGLAAALRSRMDVSVLFMRRLMPRRWYPGKMHVGRSITEVALPADTPSFDGVDWFWVPSIFRAVAFLMRERPRVVILQWWTGTVLHSYLVIAAVARLLKSRLVVEFHESLDTGEQRIPLVGSYVRSLAPRLFRAADALVVHSRFDLDLITRAYGLPSDRFRVVPHAAGSHSPQGPIWREAPDDTCNLLCFGVIRPFKGVEDLVAAFDAIPDDEIGGYWLTVVGETWEGWTKPAEAIRRSRHRERITFVNRYVTDEEVEAVFRGADLVVLPYRRSSQSGPLHLALGFGLPVVVTRVGGLVEAVEAYAGAVLVDPHDPLALLGAIRRATGLTGRGYTSTQGWSLAADLYEKLVDELMDGPASAEGASGRSSS